MILHFTDTRLLPCLRTPGNRQDVCVTLADHILPLVRTRTDLHRWRASNDYGFELHDAVTLLQDAAENEPPADVLAVTQKAIASACKVIMRADDSSGIIGDAIRQLLELHAQLASTAPPPYRCRSRYRC